MSVSDIEEPQPPKRILPRRRWLLAGIAAIVLALYFTGRLDHALYPIGLNWTNCAQNGFGAVFCGSDLTTYEQRVQGVQQQIQRAQQQAQQAEQQLQSQLQQQP